MIRNPPLSPPPRFRALRFTGCGTKPNSSSTSCIGSGGALDGVGRAEDGVDGVGLAEVVRQGLQTALELGQVLFALLEEDGADACQGVRRYADAGHGRLGPHPPQRFEQLLGVERLDDPAGRAGLLGARLAVRRAPGWPPLA